MTTLEKADKLQKLLANAGRGSRRQIEKWIEEGRIVVNGKRATIGMRAHPRDSIAIDGKTVRLSSGREITKALIYNKPEGEVVSRNDPQGRPTVFEKLPNLPNGRWIAVGRLDLNTSGLLLFTNNGEVANKLMHPSTGVEREYLARIRGELSVDEIKLLTTKGVILDGQTAKFERIIAADLGQEGTNHWYRVVITEGRNREVRRIFDSVDHRVSRLKRIRYGTIRLTRDVKLGQHTKVAPQQLSKLFKSAEIDDAATSRRDFKFAKSNEHRSKVSQPRNERSKRTSQKNKTRSAHAGKSKPSGRQPRRR